MKKEVIFILVVFIFVLTSIIGIITAFNSNNYNEKIDSKILKEFDSGKEKVRVIVDTNSNENDKSIFSAFLKKPTRDELINKIGKEKVKHKLSNTSFSAKLSKEEISDLIEEDYIIGYIWPVKLYLQDSVELINATSTWNIQEDEINLTGQKQTICILDTGVNFNHLDLINKNLTCNIDCVGQSCSEDCSISDDHGHGTHIAGIISADSGLTGVSFDSNLIGVKVLNSQGGGNVDDVLAGFQWCIDNSNIYNISVISMSLGCNETIDGYSDYCDSSSPIENGCGRKDFTTKINNAFSNNISVVTATGNDYWTDSIAAPACIKNSTRVGSSTKSDSVSSFSNTWSLRMLLAPGSSINSTDDNGGYISYSGTSMATPHVAGAIAIINQYLSLTSQTKTPLEIENILNNTGKRIHDDGSGLDYSRIDVYNSVISLDNSNPVVNLKSPLNNTISYNSSQDFSCNASDLSLKNATFYLWNSTGIHNTSFETVSGDYHTLTKNITNLPNGDYFWNCLFYDENENSAFATNNYTFTINSIDINLISPLNNTKTNSNQTYICNASSSNGLTNVSFKIWNSSGNLQYNKTKIISGKTNQTDFSYNFSNQGDYFWNCFFRDNNSFETYNENNFSITYDITFPNLLINSPLNNSWINKENFNVTLNENGNCIFSLNNQNNISMNTSDNRTFYYINNSLNSTSNSSDFNITYYCNDTSGNLNSSSIIYFGIEKTKPIIKLLSPSDDYSETTSSKTFNFIFNVSDNLSISSCELIINGTSNSITQNTSNINQSENNTISKTLSSGTYSWKINCTDSAGNENSSEYRNIILSTPPSSSPSSGGGGGSVSTESITDDNKTNTTQNKTPSEQETIEKKAESTNIYKINYSDLKKGKSYDLQELDKIEFNISEIHILKINKIKNNSIDITIFSNPINLTLFIEQETKLNLTSKDYYDIYLRLNNISDNNANLTIKSINSEIDKNFFKEEIINTIKNNLLILYFVIVMIIIIFLIGVLYYLIKKNETTKTNTKRKKKVSAY